MFHVRTITERSGGDGRCIAGLLDQLARCSKRPRYAFMLLNLIAEAAGPDGSAGPIVRLEGEAILLRDWLCDALSPMGRRDPRRIALAERVREELARDNALPDAPELANAMIEDEVRQRVRASGKCNLSRTVSELVSAGLLRRHYQGYWVDHHNRGAQRQAVYTLLGPARRLVRANRTNTSPPRTPIQGELAFS